MALREYKPGTAFPGRMGRTISESEPAWPEPVRAKEGAPNVLFIVLDDTGFGQLGCYGSPMNTPNLNRLAENGLLYNSMHTTALCSPTRSCILTGRNHHSNGMSCITEGSEGYPGSNGVIGRMRSSNRTGGVTPNARGAPRCAPAGTEVPTGAITPTSRMRGGTRSGP